MLVSDLPVPVARRVRLCYEPDVAERGRRGPGPLVVVHKSLIVSALVCALVFAVWEVREFLRTGARADAVVAALAAATTAALAVYFHSLRHLGAKLTAADDARRDA